MDSEEAKQRLASLRNMVFLPLSFMTIAGIGLAAVISFVTPGGSNGLFEAMITMLVIGNLFASFSTLSVTRASTHLVALLGIFLGSGLYNSQNQQLEAYWLVIFPVIAVLFLGISRGLLFIIGLLATMIPLAIGLIERDVTHSAAYYIELALSMLIISALVIYYEYVLSKHIRESAARNTKISATAADLKHEVAQRERAEAQMADALKKLGEKNQELERTQAIDEATISSIGEAVLIVNPRGIIMRANPSAGRVLGVNQEELINQRISKSLIFAKQGKEDVQLKEDQIAIAQSMQHRSINEATYKVTRPGGKSFYAHMTASPLVVGGVVYGAVVVILDVTQEVIVDRAKSEFVSIASHQLRTPLSTINWYLEMVMAGDFGEVNPEQSEFISEAAEAAKRMGSLLNALLNASRIDVGVVAVEPEMHDLRDSIKSVLVDLESRITERNITVHVNVDDSVQPTMLDPRIMEIIFMNLISNAVKYSPKGNSVEVNATLENQQLVITVADHGFGIPEADQQKIFTKMFRAGNAVDHEPDGNGLGVYIIKSILDTIGGSIDFVSKENEGTTFTVRLSKDGMKPRGGTKQLNVTPDM